MSSPIVQIDTLEQIALADARALLRRALTDDEARVAVHTVHTLAAVIVGLRDRVTVQRALIVSLEDGALDAILLRQRIGDGDADTETAA